LNMLQSFLSNASSNDKELNPSITSFVLEQNAQRMCDMFLDVKNDEKVFPKKDIVFESEGVMSMAHAAIVSCRCEPLGRMILNPVFVEGKGEKPVSIQTSPGAWLLFVRYLYTERTYDLEGNEEELVDLLQLADLYCAPRMLSMAELYISKLVERATADDLINQEQVDLVQLLNLCVALKADQLTAFLKHFMCVNYFAMSQRKDFEEIEEETRNEIIENQWPPISYYEDVAKYEKQLEMWKKKNKIKQDGGGFFSRLLSRVK